MTATLSQSDIEIADDVEQTAPLVKFSVTEKSIAEAKARHAKLIALPKIPEDELRSELTALVTCRTTIDKERKFQNDAAHKHIKFVNSEAARVTAELAPLESDLEKRWNAIVAEKARVKAAAEAAKAKAIQDQIDKENAIKRAELEREAAELKSAQEALAESRRKLEAEQAAAKAKADAEAAEQRARDESARKERERLEAIEREKQRQADEVAAKAEREKLKAEADRLAKIEVEQAAERKRIADEAAKVRAAKEKAEREEFERRAKIEAERLAKEKADRERIAAEEARVAEAERLAALKARQDALAPDKEKIAAWAHSIRLIDGPAVKSAEAKEMVDAALNDLRDIAKQLDTFVEQN